MKRRTKATKPLFVWKKAYFKNRYDWCAGGVLVKLKINTRTRYLKQDGLQIGERKCRAACAVVMGFYDIDTREKLRKDRKVGSKHDSDFLYVEGAKVKPKEKFDTSFRVCASGIHFFFNQDDAARYNFS